VTAPDVGSLTTEGKAHRPSSVSATVSVGVPTLDRPDLLRGAVVSILAQDFRDVEIAVVDNGSHQLAREVLSELRDPRLRILRNERTIPRTENYNIALRAGSGRYVAILADDDEWLPSFLTRAVGLLERHPDVVIVHTGYEVVDAQGEPLYVVRSTTPTQDQIVPGQRYINWMLAGARRTQFTATIIRRAALPSTGFLPADDFADDLGLLLRVATKGSVAFVDEPLTRVRFHQGTVTAGASVDLVEDRYRLSVDFRAQCRDVKLRFLAQEWRARADASQLRRVVRRSFRKHLLVQTARALRRPVDLRAAWSALVRDSSYDRACLVDPRAWKWAIAAYLGRER
jgi:glycosyltransferase involved in cell wall biosynthesis